MNQVWGVHRGTVTGNVDPLQLGRMQVSVPAVLGDAALIWAMPSSPYAGNGVGLFAVPPVDANVWVAFEGGDIDRPIVLGAFWGVGETPAMPALPQTKIFKTDAITIKLDDLPGAGGVTIEVSAPAVALPVKLSCTSAGIEISVAASKVVLNGVSVSINDGALEVI